MPSLVPPTDTGMRIYFDAEFRQTKRGDVLLSHALRMSTAVEMLGAGTENGRLCLGCKLLGIVYSSK